MTADVERAGFHLIIFIADTESQDFRDANGTPSFEDRFWNLGGPHALPRRPMHAPAAQKVQMQVSDRLSAVRFCVDHESKTGSVNLELARDSVCRPHKRGQKVAVVFFEFGDIGNMTFVRKQNMNRRLGVYVCETQHRVVFKNDLGGDFVIYDFTEEAIQSLKHCLFAK